MAPRPKLFLITTGGTIFQREAGGKMEISLSAQELASQLEIVADVECHELSRRSGADLTFETLVELRDRIAESRSTADGTVLITGTDSMEEVAFALDLMLEPGKPVVVTGAMKPSDVLGYDGVANLNDAIKVARAPEAAGLGVLLVLNESVHPARYVHKQDSLLPGSFQSHPGPIAQMRLGRPLFYYTGLPAMDRFLKPDITRLLASSVMVWPMTIQPSLPESTLESLDGLIIAGMGTGSVAKSVVEQLAPRWTQRIPIVLSSRCPVGLSYDDHYYRGSREKYESLGFRILGYESCNPLQARLKLLLELASGS